jgi:hypothetical protein
MVPWELSAVFRPYGAGIFILVSHGSRRGLHSFAASRLLSCSFGLFNPYK